MSDSHQTASSAGLFTLPTLPCSHSDFIRTIADRSTDQARKLLGPFNQYDAELRRVFAQSPTHPATQQANIVPVFAGHEHQLRVRARDLEAESAAEKDRYILPLPKSDRKATGSPAVVPSLQDFGKSFNVFTENALAEMDWTNVVAAGSSVLTPLLPVPENRGKTKRQLRKYFHEEFAPASDIDLFIYGLNGEEAVVKMRQIEQSVRDAVLSETSTIRTKNAITIVSQYPTRHIQIVLRLYQSVSEILTGFDIDCACVAYDGKQVYASPRAIVALMTQVNTIDLGRRSPSYENRLAKYATRGFEVYWPQLDRSKVDPTIFERSFNRTVGLARLLVLERLPSSTDREQYLDQRRAERGRPTRNAFFRYRLAGDIKSEWENEVAEWNDSAQISSYTTFTIPYGPKFSSRRIEKLLYTKDLLLNAEWNQPKDRDVHLHRHPAFFGTFDEVIGDCCGFCPSPADAHEEEVASEESKIYVQGTVRLKTIDPGQQEIGSFNPLTADDWTDMAYITSAGVLSKAIVANDVDAVSSWLAEDGNDPDARDWTGRAPLHLAAEFANSEIVQLLIDHGVRLTARLYDGRTALHIAAMNGRADVVSALLRKSAANSEESDAKQQAGLVSHPDLTAPGSSRDQAQSDAGDLDQSDIDIVGEDSADEEDVSQADATTEHSIVKIDKGSKQNMENEQQGLLDADANGPDVYDVDVLSWDTQTSPLHLAILNGHTDVVKVLVQDHGADATAPVKIQEPGSTQIRATIMSLVLGMALPRERADQMLRALIDLGCSCSQGDLDRTSVVEYAAAGQVSLLETLNTCDKAGFNAAINNLSRGGRFEFNLRNALTTLIRRKATDFSARLLDLGAKPTVDYADWVAMLNRTERGISHTSMSEQQYRERQDQPCILAARLQMPELALLMIEKYGCDVNTLDRSAYECLDDNKSYMRERTVGRSLLDVVEQQQDDLRAWKPADDAKKSHAPIPLEEDGVYLNPYAPGSYARWSAERQLAQAKTRYAEASKDHAKVIQENEALKGTAEKAAAVQTLITGYESLRARLLAKNAVRFYETHPEIKKPTPEQLRMYDYSYIYQRGTGEPRPFELNFAMASMAISHETKERYHRLYEACWTGDIEGVKSMALRPWKTNEGIVQPPLSIAVRDAAHSMSPLSIAVMNGHLELASWLVAITEAQYASPGETTQKRYYLDDAPSDDDMTDQDSDTEAESSHRMPRLRSDIVDDGITLESVAAVSLQVKSRRTPSEMLLWPCPPHLSLNAASTDGSNADSLKPVNLFQYAMQKEDFHLLRLLLDLAKKHYHVGRDGSAESEIFTLPVQDIEYALKLDNPALIEIVIKKTGALIPKGAMGQENEAQVLQKPKYYQGLSVHGKKRKDWAAAGRATNRHSAGEGQSPPLLLSAKHYAQRVTEWFLSDAPQRCYREFADQHREDERLSRVREASGGLEHFVFEFLEWRSDMVLHCYLLGTKKRDASAMAYMRYLVSAVPDSLNARNKLGVEPLALAFHLKDSEAIKTLQELGANESCRDDRGRNVVHFLYGRPTFFREQHKLMPELLDLVNPRLLPKLLLERCSMAPGSLTPLALCLHRASTTQVPDPTSDHAGSVHTLCATLISRCDSEVLRQIDGAGDTPLHCVVKKGAPALARRLLEHCPSLLNHEDATGRTPYEVVRDNLIIQATSRAPTMPNTWGSTSAAWERVVEKYDDKTDGWEKSIIDRSPESFVSGRKCTQSSTEALWQVVEEFKGRLQREDNTARRLVSLSEANEVAKRLAGRQRAQKRQKKSEGEELEDDEEQQREVDLWFDHDIW